MPLISSACPFVNPYLSLFVHSWPSFLFQIWSVLTLATWPMQFSDQLSFWSFFPVKPAHKPCRAKGKYPIQSRFSLMGWKKKTKTRMLSTQKFILQMLLQISTLTRPAIFPNPISSFKSTRIYLFLLKLPFLFTHCFASIP